MFVLERLRLDTIFTQKVEHAMVGTSIFAYGYTSTCCNVSQWASHSLSHWRHLNFSASEWIVAFGQLGPWMGPEFEVPEPPPTICSEPRRFDDERSEEYREFTWCSAMTNMKITGIFSCIIAISSRFIWQIFNKTNRDDVYNYINIFKQISSYLGILFTEFREQY